MPIDFTGFKWITIKEPSMFLYAQRHFSCGMLQSGYLNRGFGGIKAAVFVILFSVFGVDRVWGDLVPKTFFCPIFFLRWLLPPQALNAYYLPNKNQMGECMTSHRSQPYKCQILPQTSTHTKEPFLCLVTDNYSMLLSVYSKSNTMTSGGAKQKTC